MAGPDIADMLMNTKKNRPPTSAFGLFSFWRSADGIILAYLQCAEAAQKGQKSVSLPGIGTPLGEIYNKATSEQLEKLHKVS